MTPRAHTSRRPAFTLVELIVASIMLSVLVSATYTAISQITRARDRSVARSQAHQRANLAADLIAADAQQALRDSDLAYCKIAILATRGGARDAARQDGLLLYTQISRPIRPLSGQNEGAECEAHYRLEPAPRGAAGSTLWRRRQPVPDGYPDAGGLATALVDGIESLAIDAHDGAAWTSVWDSDTDGFPHALRLSVVGVDDSGRTTAAARRIIAFDRTPLPIPIEADQSEDSADDASSASN